MMIDKRAVFSKTGEAKYISHLDLYRFMLRALKRAGLPVWHTEGFNPHAYVSFALPLSLGQCGQGEIMDFRITEYTENAEIARSLNAALPQNIRILSVSEPIHKPKEIRSAEYRVTFPGGAEGADKIKEFLSLPTIPVEKRTKKGVSDVDLARQLLGYKVSAEGEDAVLMLEVPTGTENNINPALFVDALEKNEGLRFEPTLITRTRIFLPGHKIFD